MTRAPMPPLTAGVCAVPQAAASSGAFESEIVPVAVKQRRGTWVARYLVTIPAWPSRMVTRVGAGAARAGAPKMVTADEEPVKNAASALGTDAAASAGGDDESKSAAVPASLSKLRPAFKRDGGTVTAGNASTLR